MVALEIGDCELDSKGDVVYVLIEIAHAIEQGYTSGCTVYGVCWSVSGEDEDIDDDL